MGQPLHAASGMGGGPAGLGECEHAATPLAPSYGAESWTASQLTYEPPHSHPSRTAPLRVRIGNPSWRRSHRFRGAARSLQAPRFISLPPRPLPPKPAGRARSGVEVSALSGQRLLDGSRHAALTLRGLRHANRRDIIAQSHTHPRVLKWEWNSGRGEKGTRDADDLAMVR